MLKNSRISVHLDGNAPFSCVIPTRFADVDWLGHINNVATAQIIEDARTRFSDWMDIHEFVTGDVRFLTASIQIDYVGEAFYPVPYTVHAAVGVVGRSSWSYVLTARQNDKVVAAAISTQAATSGTGPWSLPEQLRERLSRFAVAEADASEPRRAASAG